MSRPFPPMQTVSTGLVVAVVGFFSSFPIVLQGLDAMGASGPQAASGLMMAALAMGLAAMHLPAAQGVAMLGAGLFVASDLVLSVELFRMQEDSPATRVASHLVWPLYWVGQGLILAGIAWT